MQEGQPRTAHLQPYEGRFYGKTNLIQCDDHEHNSKMYLKGANRLFYKAIKKSTEFII